MEADILNSVFLAPALKKKANQREKKVQFIDSSPSVISGKVNKDLCKNNIDCYLLNIPATFMACILHPLPTEKPEVSSCLKIHSV